MKEEEEEQECNSNNDTYISISTVAETINENSSCMTILLLAEVLTSNICYIAYVVLNHNMGAWLGVCVLR